MNKAVINKTCETCKFFSKEWDGAESGTCRKNPPAATWTDSTGTVTYWPDVRPQDWCGEYKPQTKSPSRPG